MNSEVRFEVIGDLSAPSEVKDVTHIYANYSENGVKEDEKIHLNWRVIDVVSGRTVAVFGGGAGYDAASVFKNYCEENY
jgi:hypothetical protein